VPEITYNTYERKTCNFGEVGVVAEGGATVDRTANTVDYHTNVALISTNPINGMTLAEINTDIDANCSADHCRVTTRRLSSLDEL